MTTTKQKPLFTTYELCATALGAALIAVCAWISIPAAIPFTLQTFAIFFVTGLLGLKCGTLSVLVYLLLGAVGLPVFAGFGGGIGTLVGVTGGYLIGFLFSALVVGLITKKFGRGFVVLLVSMVLGLIVCYAFGSAWFYVVYTKSKGAMAFATVLTTCVVPFLIPDGIKILLAALLVGRLKNVVRLK